MIIKIDLKFIFHRHWFFYIGIRFAHHLMKSATEKLSGKKKFENNKIWRNAHLILV